MNLYNSKVPLAPRGCVVSQTEWFEKWFELTEIYLRFCREKTAKISTLNKVPSFKTNKMPGVIIWVAACISTGVQLVTI